MSSEVIMKRLKEAVGSMAPLACEGFFGDASLLTEPRYEDEVWRQVRERIHNHHYNGAWSEDSNIPLRPEDVRWYRNHVSGDPDQLLIDCGWPKPKEAGPNERHTRDLYDQYLAIARAKNAVKPWDEKEYPSWYPESDGQYFEPDWQMTNWQGKQVTARGGAPHSFKWVFSPIYKSKEIHANADKYNTSFTYEVAKFYEGILNKLKTKIKESLEEWKHDQ